MSPEFDGTLPDSNGYKFVRVGDRIVYDDPLANQHADIARSYGMATKLGEDGKPIVDDAGGMNQHPSGEIRVFGDSSTCIVEGDFLKARQETLSIIDGMVG